MNFDRIGAVAVSILAVAVFGFMVMVLVLHPLPAGSDTTLLNVLVGTATAGFMLVLNYWLGSSASSSRKDKTISAIATSDLPPIAPPPPTT